MNIDSINQKDTELRNAVAYILKILDESFRDPFIRVFNLSICFLMKSSINFFSSKLCSSDQIRQIKEKNLQDVLIWLEISVENY
jgi:hypothetical protein